MAGIDEAGRGPLAGPVVAAALIFPAACDMLAGVNDSKKLTARQRETLYDDVLKQALASGIGVVEASEIDRINILQATYKAMRQALGRLRHQIDHILVDGRALPGSIYPQTAIVGGDRTCYSIAAASIVAKVFRDRLMRQLDEVFPNYGFAQHKGYGTARHLAAIALYKPCPVHRLTFQGVREHLPDFSGTVSTKETGRWGEHLAAYYLFRHGWRIRQRNYRAGVFGEIDIIAQKGRALAFIEVKTARVGNFGPPETWVDQRKATQLGQIAEAWLAEQPEEEYECRFDVIGVSWQNQDIRINHVEDAILL